MAKGREGWSIECGRRLFLDFMIGGKGILELLVRTRKQRRVDMECYQLTVVL